MNRSILAGLTGLLFTGLSAPSSAAPISFDFDFVFTGVEGIYAADISVGDSVIGSYVYDTDESLASAADTTPGTVPGHEYSSRYTFSGAQYGADFFIPALGDGFTDMGDIEVLVNNDLFLTAEETGGLLADGTYDWIEILATTAVDVCPTGMTCPPDPYTPGDGEEWTLAIFGPSDWFSDGSLIPDNLPADYQVLLVGLAFDANGDEIGAAFATTAAVPLPAGVWLLMSGLLGLVGAARKRAA